MKITVALCAAVAALVLAATASGHATLDSTAPQRGERLPEPPESVAFRFSEPVESSFGSVRVFDGEGNEVEGTEEFRPGDDSTAVGLQLPGDLADGAYTATYRVVSADSHPITGGFVFTVGDGSGAPAATVSELLDGGDTGPVTEVAATVVRFVIYAAIALAVGGMAFALLVFGPAIRRAASGDHRWREAGAAFSERLRRIVGASIAAGLTAGALGIGLQGAIAGGTSFWSALDPSVVGDVLATRFGTIWGLRELAWIALGAAALAAPLAAAIPRFRPVDLGAAGVAPLPSPSPVRLALLAPPALFLILSPGIAGHAATRSPAAIVTAIDSVHVLAMCLWIGGVVMLLGPVRAATAELPEAARTRLLAANLLRFSPIALWSVIALATTGTFAAVVHLEAVAELWQTGFGRAILVKIGVLGCLVAIGAVHRRRHIPALRRAANGAEAPGSAGRATRLALRAEVALFMAVIGATAILVGQTTPDAVSQGPASATATVGDARLDVSVEPALAGSNEVHFYLFDSVDGSQYDDLRGVEVTANLPAKGIGPLEVELENVGPGHYTAPNASLGAPGTWELTLAGKLSKFEEPRGVVEVEIE